MFWSQWMGKYWNVNVVKWLRKDWKISLLRAAYGIEMGGHLENPATELAKLPQVVETAIKVGIYVIIDWHDHTAHELVEKAKTFFDEMAKKYGKLPNVIFETFNEPVHQNWAEVKRYHTQVVSAIREHTDNLVIAQMVARCGCCLCRQSARKTCGLHNSLLCKLARRVVTR